MIQIPNIDNNMIANNLIPFEPTHPGEILREEIECRGITQTALAAEIGVAKSLINEMINGKRDFTIEHSMMLEAALGIDADFWINLQTAYNKNKAAKNVKFTERLARIKRIAAVL